MVIREIDSFTDAQLADLGVLMNQLSDHVVLTRDVLSEMLRGEGNHLYVVLDGERIIGCASLCLFISPTGRKASVEDVVVLADYRGQHLGKQLVEYVLNDAKRFAPIKLQLTSRPSRVAANHLYRSVGFQLRETNCYGWEIKDILE